MSLIEKKQTLHVTFEYVTPLMASAWLENIDPMQRKVRPTKVKQFESMLKKGELMCTHQGLLISEKGTLLDGQHRLHAIVNTGISAKLMVTRNAPQSLMSYLDGGTPRTDADRLNVSPDVVAVANCLARFGRPAYEVTASVKQQVIAVVGERVQELRAFAPTCVRNLTVAQVRAAVVLHMHDERSARRTHAMNQYRAITLSDYASFSHYVGLFHKQALRGSTSTGAINKDDLFIRAWLAFDVRNESKNLLLIRDFEARRYELLEEIESQIPSLSN